MDPQADCVTSQRNPRHHGMHSLRSAPAHIESRARLRHHISHRPTSAASPAHRPSGKPHDRRCPAPATFQNGAGSRSSKNSALSRGTSHVLHQKPYVSYLLTFKIRFAFFKKSGNAFGAVFALAQLILNGRFNVECGRPGARSGMPHRLLRCCQ